MGQARGMFFNSFAPLLYTESESHFVSDAFSLVGECFTQYSRLELSFQQAQNTIYMHTHKQHMAQLLLTYCVTFPKNQEICHRSEIGIVLCYITF